LPREIVHGRGGENLDARRVREPLGHLAAEGFGSAVDLGSVALHDESQRRPRGALLAPVGNGAHSESRSRSSRGVTVSGRNSRARARPLATSAARRAESSQTTAASSAISGNSLRRTSAPASPSVSGTAPAA